MVSKSLCQYHCLMLANILFQEVLPVKVLLLHPVSIDYG